MIFLIISASKSFSKSIVDNEFGKSAKDCGLKIDTDVVLYERLNGGSEVVVSLSISGAGVSDPDEVQRHLHGVDPGRGSGCYLLVIRALVNHECSFPILYPYGFHCTSNDAVPESLENVSMYGFYVWDSQALKGTGNERNESSLKIYLTNTEKKQKARVEMAWRP